MKVTAIVERSDGKLFNIDDESWRIPSDGLDGFGSLENDITTEDSAIGDGSIYASNRVPEKDRTIYAEYCGSGSAFKIRFEACRFFTPQYTYKVHLTYMGYSRWCEGKLYKFKAIEQNIHKRPAIQFTILCPDPYLRSESDYGKSIGGITANHAFPYLCPIDSNLAVSYYNSSQQGEIFNFGDVQTDFKIVISFSSTLVSGFSTAYCLNPEIVVNGKHITINGQYTYGDIITIDMTQRPYKIYDADGNNMINYLTKDSDLTGMELNTGSNTITYAGDNSDESGMIATVYFNEKYATM